MKFRNFPSDFDKRLIMKYCQILEERAQEYGEELVIGYVNNTFKSVYGNHEGLICCIIEPHKDCKKYRTTYYIFDKTSTNPVGRVGPSMRSKDDAIYFIDCLVGVNNDKELLMLEKRLKKEELKR